MILSYAFAIVYTIVYSTAIFYVRHKAKDRLLRRKSSIKKGLIGHQQNLTPNTDILDGNNQNGTKQQQKRTSQIIDAATIQRQYQQSMPYGPPISSYEIFVAIIHSLDSGLHFGLLLEMINGSQHWNLSEQYLIICLFILLFYRIVSFITVYISLPRYSYTKSVKSSGNGNGNGNLDIENQNSNNSNQNDNNNNQNDDNNSLNVEIELPTYKRSCLSYCWLQFFFDCGYIMELAPWLWNWEQTKIILPEFAWFSKLRTLFQSFPFAILMVVSLLSIDNVSQHIHIYFIVSLLVSLICIITSLTLYDNRTLIRDNDDRSELYTIFTCNFVYRLLSVTSRIIILSFLIALFPWPVLFAILLIPIIAYSGPYCLGNNDCEVFNLIYKSLLVFPDYSSPFGRISESEAYLNVIHRIHLIIIILFGFPLITLFIIVEKVVFKLLKIDSEVISSDREKYASFRITTYTLSRLVESLIECGIIFGELYAAQSFRATFVIYDSLLVHLLFWCGCIFSIISPIPYIKLYDKFVVDNEEDYELSDYVTPDDKQQQQQPASDYIMSTAAYNTDKFIDGDVATTTNNNIPHQQAQQTHQISYNPSGIDGIIDIRGSRQYLRQKQYWIAVHRNNSKELAWVLRSRQHVNLLEYNDRQQLGITIVALRHDWNCLKLLISAGGGLRYLVRYAALHGEVEILSYLHNVLNINVATIQDNADERLLFSAIEGSQANIVKLLAEFGANLTAPSSVGSTAVILAAENGDLEILRILGDNGVDLNITDDNGNTVAHYAAQIFNGSHILTYLNNLYHHGDDDNKQEYGGDVLNGFNFNHQNKRGATAAYCASQKGQLDNLRALGGFGADFTITNVDGDNCLIAAASEDHRLIVSYLIESKQLEVDYSNDCQETALYCAASNGCTGSLSVLINNKCNLEICDKYRVTALMVAAERGETRACEILLSAGANPNHQNQDGETALMKSCAEGYIDCVKLLIKYKTDYTIVDDEGNPAILWCCMTGNMKIFQYLVLDALKLNKNDIESTINNDKETCIDWIVENKLDIGLQVLQQLNIDVTPYLEEDDDDDDNDDDYDDDDDGNDDSVNDDDDD